MNREQSTAGNASERPALPEGVLNEARARIIWGDEPKTVRAYLVSRGLSQPDADATIKSLLAERNSEIRGIGLRNLLIGLAIVGVTGPLIYLDLSPTHHGTVSVRSGKGLAMLGFLGLIGVWKLLKGIIYLLRPQSEHSSVSGMDNFN